MQLFSFSFDDSFYTLEFGFDDAAIMENSVAFDVTARRYKEDDSDSTGVSVTVRVEIFPWENVGTISVEGQEVHRFQLLDQGDTRLEQVLQSIPVPDPILGCAIKAGVSAVIGQAIKCRTDLERNGFFGQIATFARCMRENLGGIGRKALRRAFGCMISAGLL